MAQSRRHELGVGALVLGAAALLAWMALQVGALRGLGGQVRATVRMDDAGGLTESAVVKIAGVDVGRVTELRIEHDQAVVELELRQDAMVRQDARVRVRARSVLGEKYVELLPRSSDAPLLVDGGELQHGAAPVEIDQLVNDLGPIISAVDPEVIQRSMGVLEQALAEDPQRVERMLVDLEVALDHAATASAELPGLVQEARATLATVRATAQEARPVLARADRVVGQLEAATTDLGRSRAELDGLVQDTRAVVQDGGRLVQRLEENGDLLERVLHNAAEIDKWELRRLLREEGIVVRMKASEVIEEAPQGSP